MRFARSGFDGSFAKVSKYPEVDGCSFAGYPFQGNFYPKGAKMRQRLDRAVLWVRKHLARYDLLPDYWHAVVIRTYDILWGTSPLFVVFLIWWSLGSPPSWFVMTILAWAFLLAGYFSWRDVVAPRFRSWISDMTLSPNRLLFVGLKIVNVGPPTSIPIWFAGCESDGQRIAIADTAFVDADDQQNELFKIQVPSNIRGSNLLVDQRRLETGETRDGWLAFNVGTYVSEKNDVHILQSVSVRFVDAFGEEHETTLEPEWFRKLKR